MTKPSRRPKHETMLEFLESKTSNLLSCRNRRQGMGEGARYDESDDSMASGKFDMNPVKLKVSHNLSPRTACTALSQLGALDLTC